MTNKGIIGPGCDTETLRRPDPEFRGSSTPWPKGRFMGTVYGRKDSTRWNGERAKSMSDVLRQLQPGEYVLVEASTATQRAGVRGAAYCLANNRYAEATRFTCHRANDKMVRVLRVS